MTEVIHGLASGLLWSTIIGTCWIVIAAIITATATARARMLDTGTRTTPHGLSCDSSGSEELSRRNADRTFEVMSELALIGERSTRCKRREGEVVTELQELLGP